MALYKRGPVSYKGIFPHIFNRVSFSHYFSYFDARKKMQRRKKILKKEEQMTRKRRKTWQNDKKKKEINSRKALPKKELLDKNL